jgi:hypothetical protein
MRSLVVLLCLVGLSPAAARPEKHPPVAPIDRDLELRRQKATELTDRAYRLQRKGAMNDAIQLYQEALALDPLPKRYYNLGIPLQESGRLAEALRAFRSFQRDDLGELPEYRHEVDERIAALCQKLGTVIVSAPLDEEVKVSVRLFESTGDRPRCVADPAAGLSSQPGIAAVGYLCQEGLVRAELLIGDKGVAERNARAVAGSVVRLSFSPRSPVTISANRSPLSLQLDAGETGPNPQGRPGLVAPPPVKVPMVIPLLVGGHELLAWDGKDVLSRRFTVQEGMPTEVDLRFPLSRRFVPWLIGGVAVAVAVGVVLGVTLWPAPAGGADVTLPSPMQIMARQAPLFPGRKQGLR